MKFFLLRGTGVLLILYVLGCAWLYVKQETLLFYPQRLPAAYKFGFPGKYIEYTIISADGIPLNGLLFKADAAKGLVFFLHGNAGSLADWGRLAPVYQQLGYDVFMLDYRGYGKSQGTITSQAQLLNDVEAAYQQVASRYAENTVVIAGYSLGTGPAAWLATRHQPKLLLLHAPYYSMTDMAAHTIPVWPLLPNLLLRYPLPTNEFVTRLKCPLMLVHGDRDQVIPYASSLRLKALCATGSQLLIIPAAGHNGLTDKFNYRQAIRRLL
ncbi:alpha/beta hydrolase [Hymenobacter sp. BRD67]|uniref:alpha/beta hydrolase n=1 Tax=Hymenobacter sp. BRD67 TaxID=2675877 RepID=UPI001564D014|nr:alpha/beta fold hydrolase [Hymenobacter sp. BRD67]QKG52185.1 alpha/beta fold hydrolase [Hymenobacter sp. BRD67]